MDAADEWWLEPLRRTFAGRRVVLAGGHAASWTDRVALLRSVGVEELLVIATEGRGGGRLPDVGTVIVEPPSGLTEMERIHAADHTLREPTAAMTDALDRFDPACDALVVGSFLATAEHLAGRALFSPRRPEWVALEDKVVVDAFWDRAGIARQPSMVVALDDATSAATALDLGAGTVWSADAREGFHGGARHTHWVADAESRVRALADLRPVCDRVRVMPFVEGVPCSIHGVVLPDGIALLRPVEMVTLRRGHELVYAGCATYWDPPAEAREQMRAVARRAGEQLRREVGFRGTFTVDGVVAADGFWPTELNPRFGAGIMTIARGTGVPMVAVNDLIVAGVDVGRGAARIETDIVAAADRRRGGGTWRAALDLDAEFEFVDRAASFADGRWRWAGRGDPVAGHVTAGTGFVRCVYHHDATPVGPPTAARAAAFWDFVAAETGADTGRLRPAGSA